MCYLALFEELGFNLLSEDGSEGRGTLDLQLFHDLVPLFQSF